MSLPRYAAKRDLAERPIIDALRQVGAEVWPISGDGLPDLLVRYRGKYFVGEVKSTKYADKRRVKQTANAFPRWMTPEEALRSIGAAR